MGGTSGAPIGKLFAEAMIWVADADHIVDNLKALGVADPKKWRCPCRVSGCKGVVVYGRHDDGRVYFQSNQTFEAADERARSAIRVSDPRDLNDVSPMRAILPARDVEMFRLWMMVGLKNVLAAEFIQGD